MLVGVVGRVENKGANMDGQNHIAPKMKTEVVGRGWWCGGRRRGSGMGCSRGGY